MSWLNFKKRTRGQKVPTVIHSATVSPGGRLIVDGKLFPFLITPNFSFQPSSFPGVELVNVTLIIDVAREGTT